MGDDTPKSARGLSLGARISLVSGTLIVLSVATAVVVTSLLGARIARRAVTDSLHHTYLVQEAFQEERYLQLQLISQLFVADPSLRAYVAEAWAAGDAGSVLNLLLARQPDLGFDFAIVLDPYGEVFVRTDRPDRVGEDLARRPLVAVALEEFSAAGVWEESDRLYFAVATPIVQQLDLLGFLVMGFAIDEALLRELKRVSGTEMLFLTAGSQGPSVLASTLDRAQTERVMESLGGGEAEWRQVFEEGRVAEGLDVTAGGRRRWVGFMAPLRGAAGEVVGATVGLASMEEELATFRRIQGLLAGVGVVAVLLAVGLSLTWSRRMLRPVRRLVEAAEAARRGDYDQRLDVEGRDEIGALAQAFDHLLADLREKRDMEAFVAQMARSAPPAPGAADASPRPQPAASPEEKTYHLPSPEEDSSSVELGSVLGGRFEILGELGSGGMGVVYKALDRQLDEVVALKMIRAQEMRGGEQLERLKDELRLARKITHFNVLRTYDFGELDGLPFISMEYVPGISLRDLLNQSAGRLPYGASLRIAKQICAGLEAAHAVGVLHRDVKPENVLVESSGTAKLMDFGIARRVARGSAGLTQTGTVVGTPYYLAPEQLKGEAIDERVDIYAAGVVFFELFTGRRPFAAASPMEVVSMHLHQAPPSPRELWPEMPEELEALIVKCLEKDPERRHRSAREVLAVLDRLRS